MEGLGATFRKLRDSLQVGGAVAPQPECVTCGDTGLVSVRREVPVPEGSPWKPLVGNYASPCPACAARKEQERLWRRRQAMPEAQREYTFASLDSKRPDLSPQQTTVYLEAVRAARAMAEGKATEPWLLLAGNPGWGKTHLAVCICNYRSDHP